MHTSFVQGRNENLFCFLKKDIVLYILEHSIHNVQLQLQLMLVVCIMKCSFERNDYSENVDVVLSKVVWYS